MNKKKLFMIIFPILLISTVVIVGAFIFIPKPAEPNNYAIADTNFSGALRPNYSPMGHNVKITPEFNRLYVSDNKGCLMRFELNKPKSWSSCELSMFAFTESNPHFWVYLLSANWTETEDSWYYWRDYVEGDWITEDYVDLVTIVSVTQFRINLTDYIDLITTKVFTVAFMDDSRFDGGASFFCSEWDGIDPLFPYVLPNKDSYKQYLPQLIWS